MIKAVEGFPKVITKACFFFSIKKYKILEIYYLIEVIQIALYTQIIKQSNIPFTILLKSEEYYHLISQYKPHKRNFQRISHHNFNAPPHHFIISVKFFLFFLCYLFYSTYLREYY